MTLKDRAAPHTTAPQGSTKVNAMYVGALFIILMSASQLQELIREWPIKYPQTSFALFWVKKPIISSNYCTFTNYNPVSLV